LIDNIGNIQGIILEAERLYLRHLSQADIENLVALWTVPVVTKHAGGPLVKSI
jgi:hypothetical protein